MPRVADLLHRRIIVQQAPPPQEDEEEPTEQPAPAPSDEEVVEAVEVRGLFPLPCSEPNMWSHASFSREDRTHWQRALRR